MTANQVENDHNALDGGPQRVDLVEPVRPDVSANILLLSLIIGLFWLAGVGSVIALVIGGYATYTDRENGKIRYLSIAVLAVGFLGLVFLLLGVVAFSFFGEMVEAVGPMP